MTAKADDSWCTIKEAEELTGYAQSYIYFLAQQGKISQRPDPTTGKKTFLKAELKKNLSSSRVVDEDGWCSQAMAMELSSRSHATLNSAAAKGTITRKKSDKGVWLYKKEDLKKFGIKKIESNPTKTPKVALEVPAPSTDRFMAWLTEGADAGYVDAKMVVQLVARRK